VCRLVRREEMEAVERGRGGGTAWEEGRLESVDWRESEELGKEGMGTRRERGGESRSSRDLGL